MHEKVIISGSIRQIRRNIPFSGGILTG